MADSIHFLNVGEGDCTLIQHKSGRNTLIDICNGNAEDGRVKLFSTLSKQASTQGDFKQRYHTINPIDYLHKKGIRVIHRFILTHPDMDHMDGLSKLVNEFSVKNFWDTNNNKSFPSNHDFYPYNSSDWQTYQKIRKNNKVLKLLSHSRGQFYTQDEFGIEGNGDGLYVISPNKKLVTYAQESNNYNEISYVILYKMGNRKVLFAGDSGKNAWDTILDDKILREQVSNIDILIAPHHGRKSGGNDDYLDILNPQLALFGIAKSKDLDYSSFYNRGIGIITNNQAGSVIIKNINDKLFVYVENKEFAKKYINISDDDLSTFWEIGYL